MNDATAKLGKSKGRTIHYVPWQTTGLRLALHPILTEFILGIKVKKNGKLIRSSVLSNHYHRRTEFTEKISNSPMKKFRPTFSLKVSIYRHFLPLPPHREFLFITIWEATMQSNVSNSIYQNIDSFIQQNRKSIW